MKLSKFYWLWANMRVIAIVALILLTLFVTIKSWCYTFEMDYTGPGSEADSLDRACRERDNREAHEKIERGENVSSKDQERANDYERDHAV